MRRPVRYAFAAVLALQVFLAVWGVADQWTRGHNGWNGSAYHNAARNTLRWDVLFPLQYETANVPPKKEQLYTHAPLALHLHNVAAVKLFGDREVSIRLVAGFWSVAALCMLFAVVRRLWDDAHALAASAIYVALPINAIYTNMANHSAGFIFWSLLALYLYIRATRAPPWRRLDFAIFLATFGIASSWDWPAYYVAACIALHWAWTLIRPRSSEAASGPPAQLAVFCAWVVLLFVGHFVLVEAVAGNLGELTEAFNTRRALSW
ncbi:MAG: glycosyltransferase family 39 protein, partial [Deltaproteobacteria bacterium]|nr:glycosyltransferase family 39 protein [Deltaproteobacteria bacterium]